VPFSDAQFCAAVMACNGDPIPAQLALHFDIPALYRSGLCGAGADLIAADHSRADVYRDRLVREISLVGGLFDRDRDVVHVSLAPGMTRWLDPAKVGDLIESLDRHFHLPRAEEVDFAMTVEPDNPPSSAYRDWAGLGFNRVSVSIRSIVQPGLPADRQGAQIQSLLQSLRDAGFSNLRIELPYALPSQSPSDFAGALTAALSARPERVGLRNCAAQHEVDAPAQSSATSAMLQASMLLAAADVLEDAGYLHIGLDVFAQLNDPLTQARRHKRLHRDALGFGVHGCTDLIGFGVGAISQMGGCHAQNVLDSSGWEYKIDQGQRTVDRGIQLNFDDRIRAEILQDVLCYGQIETAELEDRHDITFHDYFAGELRKLEPLFDEGSLTWERSTILLDRTARLSAPAIAGVFDRRDRTTLAATPASIRAPG
jgi:oxygen-independent coproporphyrinogen-3 oxidase